MQDRFVITIGRQLGSGGRAIGKRIAERLGIRMYDRQLLDMAAEQSGLCPQCFEEADEKQSRRVLSTLIGYLRSPFAGDTGTDNNVLSNDALFKIQSDVIRNVAARESALFVGRCADYILQGREDCFHVFITGALPDRANRVIAEHGVAVDAARSHVKERDRKRSSYYRHITDQAWGMAANYDLCLNSSKLGIDRCVELILASVDMGTDHV